MGNADLDRAIKLLDAHRLPDGRYAYYADETGRYYVATAEQVEALCRYVAADESTAANDAYSHWCAGEGSGAEEMPRGWTPTGGLRESLENPHPESADGSVWNTDASDLAARYAVHAVGDPDLTRVGAFIGAAPTIEAAKRLAADESGRAYGTCIVDTETDAVDWGFGFGVTPPDPTTQD